MILGDCWRMLQQVLHLYRCNLRCANQFLQERSAVVIRSVDIKASTHQEIEALFKMLLVFQVTGQEAWGVEICILMIQGELELYQR